MNLVLSERLNGWLWKFQSCHLWNLEDVEMPQNEPDLTALPINGNDYVDNYEYESMAVMFSHLIIRRHF